MLSQYIDSHPSIFQNVNLTGEWQIQPVALMLGIRVNYE